MTRENTRSWQVAGCVFAALAILYAMTSQRGVCWQDSGYRQWRILTGDFTGVEGLALAHPLYIAAARGFQALFTPAHAVWALNLFSGFGLAAAAAVCAWLVQRLTGRLLAAVGAAGLLGLSHMSWWLATVTEVYTWSLALFLLELTLLYRFLAETHAAEAASQPASGRAMRGLAVLALTNGLGVAVHNFALLSLPVLMGAALVRVRQGRLRPRALAWGGMAWLAGSAPLWLLALSQLRATGTVTAVVADVLFGAAYRKQVLGVAPAGWRLAASNLALFALSLASPLWLAAPFGWRRCRDFRPAAWRVCLAGLTAIHVLFFIRYFVSDQALFSLPTLGLLAVWSGLGLGAWLSRQAGRPRAAAGWIALGLACLPAAYLTANWSVRHFDLLPARARALPFRDEARYWLLPWKHDEHSAADFARAVYSQCSGDDTIYADSTAAGPLAVAARIEPANGRPRPALITYYDSWTRDREAWTAFLARLGSRPFHVVSPAPGYLPAGLKGRGAVFTPTGVLYRVELTTSAVPGHRPR